MEKTHINSEVYNIPLNYKRICYLISNPLVKVDIEPKFISIVRGNNKKRVSFFSSSKHLCLNRSHSSKQDDI